MVLLAWLRFGERDLVAQEFRARRYEFFRSRYVEVDDSLYLEGVIPGYSLEKICQATETIIKIR